MLWVHIARKMQPGLEAFILSYRPNAYYINVVQQHFAYHFDTLFSTMECSLQVDNVSRGMRYVLRFSFEQYLWLLTHKRQHCAI